MKISSIKVSCIDVMSPMLISYAETAFTPGECPAGDSECAKQGVHHHKMGILLRYAPYR
jgi:hypothetical protein